MRLRIAPLSLSNYLADAYKEGQLVYAVLEPAAWPNLDSFLEQSELQWLHLAKGTLTAGHYAVLPRVVLLRPHKAALRQMAENLRSSGILVAAQKNVDLYTLTAHLWDIAQARLSDGQAAWLRYYEPYVLHECMRAFNAEQKAAMFGTNVTSFAALDYRSLELRNYPKLQDSAPVAPPVRLNHEQIEAFDAAHLQIFVFELALYLASERRPTMSDEDFPGFETHIAQTVEAAQQYGFVSNSNIRRFAELAVAFTWSFHEDAPARHVLERADLPPEAKIRELEQAMYNRSPSHAV